MMKLIRYMKVSEMILKNHKLMFLLQIIKILRWFIGIRDFYLIKLLIVIKISDGVLYAQKSNLKMKFHKKTKV